MNLIAELPLPMCSRITKSIPTRCLTPIPIPFPSLTLSIKFPFQTTPIPLDNLLFYRSVSIRLNIISSNKSCFYCQKVESGLLMWRDIKITVELWIDKDSIQDNPTKFIVE